MKSLALSIKTVGRIFQNYLNAVGEIHESLLPFILNGAPLENKTDLLMLQDLYYNHMIWLEYLKCCRDI